MKNLHQLEAGYLLNKLGIYLFHVKDNISVFFQHVPFPFPLLLVFLLLLIITLYSIRLIVRIKKFTEEESVILELTPPAITEKTAYTTQQLFSTIHELGREQTTGDKFLGKKDRFSFEIVSTHDQGIRYLIRTAPQHVNNFKRNLFAYLPHVKIQTVDEYLPKDFETTSKFHFRIVEYKLSKSFALPLQKQDVLKENDPVAYITGMMTKLSPGELTSFQIILSPTKSKERSKIAYLLRTNQDVLEYLNKHEYPFLLKIIFAVLKVFFKIIKEILEGLGQVIREFQYDADTVRKMREYEAESRRRLNAPKPPKLLTPYEQEILAAIQEKINQPLFDATVRLLVVSKEKKDVHERIKGFSASLAMFGVPNYQVLKIKKNLFTLL